MTHNGRCVNPQVITPGPVRGDAQRPARTGSPKRTARKNMTAESVDYKAMQEAVHNYLTSRKAGIFFSVSGVSVVPVCSIISIPRNTYNRIIKGIKNGDSYSLIAKRIGKSEKAVRGKVYNKYLTENADKVRAMIGDGQWGDNAPEPNVKQALYLSHTRGKCQKSLTDLVELLKYRTLCMMKEVHK